MSGETIMLVHAFGSSSRAWAPQRAALHNRYRVVTPDLPGHGATPGPFTLSRAVRTVVAAAEAQPACLVGISGGAVVALLACLDHPTAVSGLVLSAGMARPPRTLPVNRAMTRLASPGALVRVLRRLYSGGNPEYVRTAGEDLRRCGKPVLLAALREIAHLDVRGTGWPRSARPPWWPVGERTVRTSPPPENSPPASQEPNCGSSRAPSTSGTCSDRRCSPRPSATSPTDPATTSHRQPILRELVHEPLHERGAAVQ